MDTESFVRKWEPLIQDMCMTPAKIRELSDPAIAGVVYLHVEVPTEAAQRRVVHYLKTLSPHHSLNLDAAALREKGVYFVQETIKGPGVPHNPQLLQ